MTREELLREGERLAKPCAQLKEDGTDYCAVWGGMGVVPLVFQGDTSWQSLGLKGDETVTIKGYKTKFQLYTVPGQVIYNTTRQLVLRGVDGLVFVADSTYEKMEENVESFKNMENNLKTLKLNLADIPYVLQYNKRDLPNAAPIEYMEFLLNLQERE